MAPREASDSPGAAATSALRGLQASARSAPLVTKDRWASQETPGPQASQVRPEVSGTAAKHREPGLSHVRLSLRFQSRQELAVARASPSLVFLCLIPSFMSWARGCV